MYFGRTWTSFYNRWQSLPVRYVCYSDRINVNKGENAALKWAISILVPNDELMELLQEGMSINELADYFYVTEDFIKAKLSFLPPSYAACFE